MCDIVVCFGYVGGFDEEVGYEFGYFDYVVCVGNV